MSTEPTPSGLDDEAVLLQEIAELRESNRRLATRHANLVMGLQDRLDQALRPIVAERDKLAGIRDALTAERDKLAARVVELEAIVAGGAGGH